MTRFRVSAAAGILGVSDDTVRRWLDSGHLAAAEACDPGGRTVIEGAELARFAQARIATAHPPAAGSAPSVSARNRFRGLVTRVVRDTVMAQVELQCGPHRVVSLMTREAADELALEPGVLAVASIKATSVVVDVPVQP